MDSLHILVILFGLMVTLAVYGTYQFATRRKTILAQRVETYAGIEEEAAREADTQLQKMSPVTRLLFQMRLGSYMEKIQESLSRADLPMKPSEYLLLRLLVAAVGYVMGAFYLEHQDTGVVLALAGFFLPAMIVWIYQRRRSAKFVRQLADALMLLTTSLRSGYSFLKGIELVAQIGRAHV